jgi:membrane protease YdiL (CAAX protease family)
MASESASKRVGAFLRSILPAEPAHWLLLFGSTFLFISQHLRWWPPLEAWQLRPWPVAVSLLSLPIVAAGAAGYYFALMPCRRPILRLITTVLLPASASLLAIPFVAIVWFPDQVGLRNFLLGSVLSGDDDYSPAIPHLLPNLGPGFECAAAGTLLVAIFTVLLNRGRATLPVHLEASHASPSAIPSMDDENRRTMLFVWMMIGLVPLTGVLDGVMVVGILSIIQGLLRSNYDWYVLATEIISAASLLPLVLLALGRSRAETLKRSFRLPPVKYLGLAAVLPAMIACVWPLALYLQARLLWAAHDFGRYMPPNLDQYLSWPSISALWYFPAALVEEIAWRGYLQPRFIRRYGLIRGVFFVGLVWGAFHFAGDFRSWMKPSDVLLQIAVRLAATLAYSYPLAWLTLRSRSVLPAAVAHSTLNIFIIDYSLPERTSSWLLIALWGIAGYVLFRYFPVGSADFDVAIESTPTTEPAT